MAVISPPFILVNSVTKSLTFEVLLLIVTNGNALEVANAGDTSEHPLLFYWAGEAKWRGRRSDPTQLEHREGERQRPLTQL